MPLYDFKCENCEYEFEAFVPRHQIPRCVECLSDLVSRTVSMPSTYAGEKVAAHHKAERKGDRVRDMVRRDLATEKGARGR
jgi:putative FmdB family regulatory protein